MSTQGPFNGIVVCLTGVSSKEDRNIKAMVQSLGGTCTDVLKAGVSCLVAKRARGAKYEVAQTLGIPRVTMDWLPDCSKSRKLLPFTKYLVGPFYGLVVSCTQLEGDDRQKVTSLVTENGGFFVKELSKDVCTHLVAMRPEGEKFLAARSWGVTIVEKEWVFDCVEKGECLDEREYLVASAKKASSPRRKAKSSSSSSSSSASAAAAEQPVAPPPNQPTRPPPAPAFNWEDVPTESLVAPSRRALLQHDIFYLSGFRPEQRDRLVGLIVAGGGRRHHVLTLGVTKVLVGKDVEKKLLHEVRRHPCGPLVVRLEWLCDILAPGHLQTCKEAREAEAREAEDLRLAQLAAASRSLQQRQEQKEREEREEEELKRRGVEEDSSAAAAAAAMATEQEEKENASNDAGGGEVVPDSQSFELNLLLQHDRSKQALEALREAGGADGIGGPVTSSRLELRRGRTIAGGAASRGQGSDVDASRRISRGQTLNAISGLKRPSRAVDLEWHPVDADSASLEQAADAPLDEQMPAPLAVSGGGGRGLKRALSNRGSKYDESQIVTWQEHG